jgi:hypothetical protein
MAYWRISDYELEKFLKQKEPKIYKKYETNTSREWYVLKDHDNKAITSLLSKFALYKNYAHGDMIVFMDEGHRQNGIMFWDAMKGKVIPPSYDHGEASLPEQFIVGEGFFDPNHWEKLQHLIVRPCKSLIKEIKSHFSKQKTPLEVTINDEKYTVIQEGEDWDNFNWNKMMLYPQSRNVLRMRDNELAQGRAVNEEKLHAFLSGDTTKRNSTRKHDLEDKLALAEQRLAEAQQEVNRLRKDLEGVGKRGTRKK